MALQKRASTVSWPKADRRRSPTCKKKVKNTFEESGSPWVHVCTSKREKKQKKGIFFRRASRAEFLFFNFSCLLPPSLPFPFFHKKEWATLAHLAKSSIKHVRRGEGCCYAWFSSSPLFLLSYTIFLRKKKRNESTIPSCQLIFLRGKKGKKERKGRK